MFVVSACVPESLGPFLASSSVGSTFGMEKRLAEKF